MESDERDIHLTPLLFLIKLHVGWQFRIVPYFYIAPVDPDNALVAFLLGPAAYDPRYSSTCYCPLVFLEPKLSSLRRICNLNPVTRERTKVRLFNNLKPHALEEPDEPRHPSGVAGQTLQEGALLLLADGLQRLPSEFPR